MTIYNWRLSLGFPKGHNGQFRVGIGPGTLPRLWSLSALPVAESQMWGDVRSDTSISLKLTEKSCTNIIQHREPPYLKQLRKIYLIVSFRDLFQIYPSIIELIHGQLSLPSSFFSRSLVFFIFVLALSFSSQVFYPNKFSHSSRPKSPLPDTAHHPLALLSGSQSSSPFSVWTICWHI